MKLKALPMESAIAVIRSRLEAFRMMPFPELQKLAEPGWGGGDSVEQEIDGVPVTVGWYVVAEDTRGVYVEVEVSTRPQGPFTGTQRTAQAIRRLPSGVVFEIPEKELIST